LAQAIFEPNVFPYKRPNNPILVILPAYTTNEDGTECSETSAHKIQKPGNHRKERIQHSQQGESLKSRKRYYFCKPHKEARLCEKVAVCSLKHGIDS
jgi:hypothetical protein